jgi:hypothetical protein
MTETRHRFNGPGRPGIDTKTSWHRDRMLSNITSSNLGTKKSHIALVSRMHGRKKQIRSVQIRTNPRILMGAKDTQIDPTSMYRISFMCAVFTDDFTWFDLIWSDLGFFVPCIDGPNDCGPMRNLPASGVTKIRYAVTDKMLPFRIRAGQKCWWFPT